MSEKNKYIACPFYKRRTATEVLCEPIGKVAELRLVFKGGSEGYIREYCSSVSKCQSCVIHKALMIKWDGK